MIVADAISNAADILRIAYPDEFKRISELLVARLLNCSRLELPLCGQSVLTAQQKANWRASLTALAAGLPWQYFVGSTDFLDLEFACDSRALIPRPETETLTEWFLASARAGNLPSPIIADMGTGSGCIIINIAAAWQHADCLAYDIAGDALDLARLNAARHGLEKRIKFIQSDLFAVQPSRSLNAIISNPPYITTAEYHALPNHIRDFEPRQALEAGVDGMNVISRLVTEAARVLKPDGALYLECAPPQISIIQVLMGEAGFVDLESAHDLSGMTRFLRGTLKTHG